MSAPGLARRRLCRARPLREPVRVLRRRAAPGRSPALPAQARLAPEGRVRLLELLVLRVLLRVVAGRRVWLMPRPLVPVVVSRVLLRPRVAARVLRRLRRRWV
jgi:hypothetical protein